LTEPEREKPVPAIASPRAWPAFEEGIPLGFREGRYRVDFARDPQELDQALDLRYRVFNLELGEGLETSHQERRDRDEFDDACHHLCVFDERTGALVGTYRLQTLAMARAGRGLYCATEFDLTALPAEILPEGVELGRACIAREHRKGHALFALWRGLAQYLTLNRKRYLFGCSSLTSQDPADGLRMLEHLRERGHVHPRIDVRPLPGLECVLAPGETLDRRRVEVPKLFDTYLRYGAQACGAPAVDRRFGTIDFFFLMDTAALDRRLVELFFS